MRRTSRCLLCLFAPTLLLAGSVAWAGEPMPVKSLESTASKGFHTDAGRQNNTNAGFSIGDVFLGVSGGIYQHYTNGGLFLENLSQGVSGFTTGCACDVPQDLHTTNFSNNDLYTFDDVHPHVILGVVPTGPDGGGNPESMVFDAAGNYYVGNAGSGAIIKYDGAGNHLATYGPPVVDRGTDWIDLAVDQQTIFYTSESGFIRRFDVSTSTQLANFANVGGITFALRLLPPGDGSGGLLVAHTADVLRLDGLGNVVQVYDVAGEDSWFSLNLDPNGSSFWAGDFGTGNFYRFNMASGAVEVGPINTLTGSNTLFGICVLGEITVAHCAHNTPPTIVEPACGSAYTVLAGDKLSIGVVATDPDSSDVVTLSSEGAAGSTLSGSSGNPASATFSWTPTAADEGTHTVLFIANDTCAPETCSVEITVIVNRPPDCSAATASPSTLWPPNHKYNAISIVGVTDPDGDPVTITVTNITQDEPINGLGDGNTCPDGLIVDGQASVRAERTGTPGVPGNGRVYAITFTADDGKGGVCRGTVNVCVPHDQGDPTCIDDGQRYSSLGPCRAGDGEGPEVVTNYGLKVGAVTGSQVALEFALPVDADVEIAAFDVAGRHVATIESARHTTGVYQRSWNMGGLANGMYFVRMRSGSTVLTQSVLKAQ